MKLTEEVRIKMAEREGWTIEPWTHERQTYRRLRDPDGNIVNNHYAESWRLPSYDNDNDLDRYIRGMDLEDLKQYIIELRKIIYEIMPTDIDKALWFEFMITATPEQKLEAIIQAEGWE